MKKASLAARARSAKAVSPAPVWTAVQPAFGASAPGLHGSGRADPLAFLLGTAVAALFAGASASFARVPMADALVAFAPGGLEAMMVLAVVLGLDPLYVVVHHLARLLGSLCRSWWPGFSAATGRMPMRSVEGSIADRLSLIRPANTQWVFSRP